MQAYAELQHETIGCGVRGLSAMLHDWVNACMRSVLITIRKGQSDIDGLRFRLGYEQIKCITPSTD